MLPRQIFDDRMEQCKQCPEWNAVYNVCLRGHRLQSPTGCPLRKFPPIFSAEYDKDCGRVINLRELRSCDGCGF